jgi:hypothetical protein
MNNIYLEFFESEDDILFFSFYIFYHAHVFFRRHIVVTQSTVPLVD